MVSGLKREDELTMYELRRRVEANGGVEEAALTENESLLLSLLEDRYAVFLEEGLRRMRMTPSSPRVGVAGSTSGAVGGRSPPNGGTSRSALSSFFSRMSPRGGARRRASADFPVGAPAGGADFPTTTAGSSFASDAASCESPGLLERGSSSDVGGFSAGASSETVSPSVVLNAPPDVRPPKAVLSGAPPAAEEPPVMAVAAPSTPGASEVKTEVEAPAMILGHWSFLDERIIIGAIPYGATCADHTGHLIELQHQCAQRNLAVHMVVACLDPDENCPPGFAGPKEWELVAGVNVFLFFPLPADPHANIDVSFEDMASLCAQIRENTTLRYSGAQRGEGAGGGGGASSAVKSIFGGPPRLNRQRAAYIHCKAGRGRSWVVAMCFFISQVGMTFAEAEGHLRSRRPKVNPSATQRKYVQEFEAFTLTPAQPIVRERPESEERYLAVLADVLSLSPAFRARLLHDLEKLT